METNICRVCGGEATFDNLAFMNYHNVRHPLDGSVAEFETKLHKNVCKCSKCGHSWVPEPKVAQVK